jgi:DICT domain-containing protein
VTSTSPSEPTTPALLTIGELGRRTGLTPAVLRTWEARHGFPAPGRSASGHRRYRESDVTLVQWVLQRQRAGVRLEAAISDVRSAAAPPSLSVFAMLRSRHPQLAPQILRKTTLLALSRAIEDEYLAGGEIGTIFGAFQKERFYRSSQARWAELARRSRTCVVFADFAEPSKAGSHGPARVPLADADPMRREWAIVAEARGLSACLAGWEPPGQGRRADRRRRFEVVWTVDPQVTRAAARVCVEIASLTAFSDARSLTNDLQTHVAPPPADSGRATALFNRAIGYVDRIPT